MSLREGVWGTTAYNRGGGGFEGAMEEGCHGLCCGGGGS